jgi:hypothetical protein
VYWGGLVIFRLTMEELLNNFFIENSIKSKTIFFGNWDNLFVLLKTPQCFGFLRGDFVTLKPRWGSN